MKKARKKDLRERVAALEARTAALEEQLRFYRDQEPIRDERVHQCWWRVAELQHVTWEALRSAGLLHRLPHTEGDRGEGIPRNPQGERGKEEGG